MTTPFPYQLPPAGILPPDPQTALGQIVSQLTTAAQTVQRLVALYEAGLPAGSIPDLSITGVGAQIQAAAQQLAQLAGGSLTSLSAADAQIASLQAQLKAANNQITVLKSGQPVTASSPGSPVLPPAATALATTTSSMTPGEAGALGAAAGLVLGSLATWALTQRKKNR